MYLMAITTPSSSSTIISHLSLFKVIISMKYLLIPCTVSPLGVSVSVSACAAALVRVRVEGWRGLLSFLHSVTLFHPSFILVPLPLCLDVNIPLLLSASTYHHSKIILIDFIQIYTSSSRGSRGFSRGLKASGILARPSIRPRPHRSGSDGANTEIGWRSQGRGDEDGEVYEGR